MTYMSSAGATQEVNHVLSSAGGKLCHYFITNPFRSVNSKRTEDKQDPICSLKLKTPLSIVEFTAEYLKKWQTC